MFRMPECEECLVVKSGAGVVCMDWGIVVASEAPER